MIAEDFVARLERVKKSGPNSWSARCPAHDDKGPSLRVTDANGKILIHCFAGCSPADIVGILGVNLSDLFPPRNEHEAVQYRREKFTKVTLKEMQQEVMICMFVLNDVLEGRPLQPKDIERARRAKATLLRLYTEIGRAV